MREPRRAERMWPALQGGGVLIAPQCPRTVLGTDRS
jgi:hypothetical protein